MIFIIAVWACAVPAGWLAGDVFHEQNKLPGDGYLWRILGAVFPPAGGVMALLVILKAEMGQ